MVQANSATAEESAASAQELSAQSAMLSKIVARFRLREYAGASLPPAPGPEAYGGAYTTPAAQAELPAANDDVLF